MTIAITAQELADGTSTTVDSWALDPAWAVVLFEDGTANALTAAGEPICDLTAGNTAMTARVAALYATLAA